MIVQLFSKSLEYVDDGRATGYQLASLARAVNADVFDDLIERQASPAAVARIAAIVKSDFRFTYFGTTGFAVRLLRLDQKLADGIPTNPRRRKATPR
jgi:hypothetical protein